RKFNEATNENPGEHFTPREVINLMVNVLLVYDAERLQQPGIVQKIYDPCCGTGGMLTAARDEIERLNPNAHVYLYGQEVNPETYAVCKSDLLMKSATGSDAENVLYGSTLSNPRHRGDHFNYILANPPYGKDWNQDLAAVSQEAERGYAGRFGAGTPRKSDGQLLFLQHMISHMYQRREGGSRIAIVLNGSPLFTGDAGSGESEIRRWILEKDWLDTIIALPEQLFYNTGIATYVWILTNNKPPERQGYVQLINATDLWVPMRKSLGDKRREISHKQIEEIRAIYAAFDPDNPRNKIFPSTHFGYRKITVERPLRLNFHKDRADRLWEQTAFQSLAISKKRKDSPEKAAEEAAGYELQQSIFVMLDTLPDELYLSRSDFLKDLKAASRHHDIKLTGTLEKAIIAALSEA
ncbi:MAG TPA: class I SAM-dependent DNA methyltransferase, partial [Aggregatilineales bacterium]|nr:class I SAM-dependent DNA methyltransferase [Aggregatilineales bacterium]